MCPGVFVVPDTPPPLVACGPRPLSCMSPPQDEISGKHSSLKKLLKAKAREDASKAKYGTKNKDAAEKDAGAAKPPPKPGKPKDEGKGKGKGVKAEDDPLPLADFQLTEYPGLPVGDTNPLQVCHSNESNSWIPFSLCGKILSSPPYLT